MNGRVLAVDSGTLISDRIASNAPRLILRRLLVLSVRLMCVRVDLMFFCVGTGDWNCKQCNHYNFARRDSCQKCLTDKDTSDGQQ
jgi:hypothetical protein